MRVLILSAAPPSRDVLRALASNGIEPVVARADAEGGTDGLVQYVRVAARGDRSRPTDLRWSRRGLRAAVRDARPALVHIVADPWTPTAEAGAAAARDLRIPYVLVGSSLVGGPKGLTARWQSDRVTAGAAAVGGSVRPALDRLLGGASTTKPTAVIPPGGLPIPAIWHARVAQLPIVFALAGRLVPERGTELLLQALSLTYGDWRLRVIGTGPTHEAAERRAQQLGLASRVEWLGALPRNQLPEFWQTIDVIAAPSLSTSGWVEPSGHMVLQAMAHGIAPIVSRCGALPDVVGGAGVIVDENDAPQMAAALQRFVSEPAECRAIGQAARQHVLERYGDGAVAERMILLWRRVLTQS